MYNGIGLSSVRGTATSGHVQANRGHVHASRRRRVMSGRDNNHRDSGRKIVSAAAKSQGNRDIQRHENRRQIENDLLLLSEDLEDRGLPEDEIEKLVQEARNEKLAALDKSQEVKNVKEPSDQPTASTLESPRGSRWGPKRKFPPRNEESRGKRTTNAHIQAMQKEKQNQKLAEAFGIQQNHHIEGKAFDQEAQKEERRKKEEEEKKEADKLAKAERKRQRDLIRAARKEKRRERGRSRKRPTSPSSSGSSSSSSSSRSSISSSSSSSRSGSSYSSYSSRSSRSSRRPRRRERNRRRGSDDSGDSGRSSSESRSPRRRSRSSSRCNSPIPRRIVQKEKPGTIEGKKERHPSVDRKSRDDRSLTPEARRSRSRDNRSPSSEPSRSGKDGKRPRPSNARDRRRPRSHSESSYSSRSSRSSHSSDEDSRKNRDRRQRRRYRSPSPRNDDREKRIGGSPRDAPNDNHRPPSPENRHQRRRSQSGTPPHAKQSRGSRKKRYNRDDQSASSRSS
mmetsp:Transcript_4238/g.8876  ORF Transcript_4238/g.8876 Transcript_4238/m.8876 type:complete len:508 (+) Transcript_4238:54-1577(+)